MQHEAMHLAHQAVSGPGALITTMFLAGLAGGATHCVSMCGPFVLSQTAMLLDDKPLPSLTEWSRLRGAALLPYHLGRMTTYAALGALAATFSAQFRSFSWFGTFSAVLLVVAGLMYLLSAFPVLRSFFPSFGASVPAPVHAAMRNLFARPQGWNGYVLGLMLGMLPCGMIYAAIVAAAAEGDPLTAVLGMIAFAVGTVPALIFVGLGGRFVMHRFSALFRYAFPALMMFNSFVLFSKAGGLVR